MPTSVTPRLLLAVALVVAGLAVAGWSLQRGGTAVAAPARPGTSTRRWSASG